ncbi:hypothetical protein OROHE_015686 [Orobanche hederae]
MSTVAAISVLRYAATIARISAVRLTGGIKPRTALRVVRIRSRVEMSNISVVSMLPYHSATASAVLTSMLPIAPLGHGWIIEEPCTRILLFGSPGTGKSLLAKAIATEIKANFINVLAASITFKWLEKTSNALFSYAKKLAPVVIYLDEARPSGSFVDSLLGARGKNETTILKGFVAAWDGLELKEIHRVLVIGGTNRPFDIDEAVICRMPRSYGGGPVRDKYYSQAQYDEVLDDWSQFVYSHLI